jgi:hypothetical protein
MRRIAAIAAVLGLMLAAGIAAAGSASAKPLRAEFTIEEVGWS